LSLGRPSYRRVKGRGGGQGEDPKRRGKEGFQSVHENFL
jgi:hypothetical protein